MPVIANFQLYNHPLSLRDVIAADFDTPKRPLPIKGGWGYSLADAIIIDQYDEAADNWRPFDGMAIEQAVVEKRLQKELVITPIWKQRLFGLRWEVTKQQLMQHEGRFYDHLQCSFTGQRNEELEVFFNALEKFGANLTTEGVMELRQLEKASFFYGTTDYYFDITSFYGLGG